MKETIVLFMCGSFNPVTNMHLRMMEIARDQLQHYGHVVKGGFISPVHDGYAKNDLISIKHRAAMLKLALESSDWLHQSTWESEQKCWMDTLHVLQHHQEKIHALMKTKNINRFESDTNVKPIFNVDPNVTIKLVCGADFLASFLVPNLWKPEHIELILKRYGIVVITRSGFNVADIIDEHDILYKFMSRIIVVNEFIENIVSSTKIRKACYRNRSIKYLVPEKVERYIKTHGLYANTNENCQSSENRSSKLTSVIDDLSSANSAKLNYVTVVPPVGKLENNISRKKRKSKEMSNVSRCVIRRSKRNSK